MLRNFIAIADTFIPSVVKSREEQFKARLILYPNLRSDYSFRHIDNYDCKRIIPPIASFILFFS